jgi:hypothetical protein
MDGKGTASVELSGSSDAGAVAQALIGCKALISAQSFEHVAETSLNAAGGTRISASFHVGV